MLVRIGCSACPDEREVAVASLEEAEALPCECGYSVLVLAISEAAPA